MTLAEALRTLGLPATASRADAKARCRQWIKRAEWGQGTGKAFWFVAAWADGESEATIIANDAAHCRTRARYITSRMTLRQQRQMAARRYADQGMTPPVIARQLGVSLVSVRRYLQEDDAA